MHEDALVSALQELHKTTAQSLPTAADYTTTTGFLKALDSSFSDDDFTTVKSFCDAWGGHNNPKVHHHIRLINEGVLERIAEGRILKAAYRELLLLAAGADATGGSNAAGTGVAAADDIEMDDTPATAASSSDRGTQRQPLGPLQQQQQQQQQYTDENNNEKATADIGGSSRGGGLSSGGGSSSATKRARLQ
jgi:hypothetical protein